MALGDETWRAGGRGEGPWQLPGEEQPLELVMRRNSLGESISLIKYLRTWDHSHNFTSDAYY